MAHLLEPVGGWFCVCGTLCVCGTHHIHPASASPSVGIAMEDAKQINRLIACLKQRAYRTSRRSLARGELTRERAPGATESERVIHWLGNAVA